MGTPYRVSDQQWTAISAPLEPAVVIAGAGSGKTSVMAARVVYLVATGQVQADEVLGLTFTTKATAELASRVREALVAAGLDEGVSGQPASRGELPERVEPMVATYNAYAAALLSEHGLRIGHEPDTRVMADASRYQVAARAIERHTGAVELLSEHPKTAIDYLLGLDAELNEHLVTSSRCEPSTRPPGPSSRRLWRRQGPRPTSPRRSRRWQSARRCSTSSRAIAPSRPSSA